jgi:hypothetical protein
MDRPAGLKVGPEASLPARPSSRLVILANCDRVAAMETRLVHNAAAPAPSGVFAGLIYLPAFSRVGVGTRVGAEEHPDRRPWFKQVSLVTVVLAYVVSLVVAYDRLASRAARRERAG